MSSHTEDIGKYDLYVIKVTYPPYILLVCDGDLFAYTYADLGVGGWGVGERLCPAHYLHFAIYNCIVY